MRTVFSTRLAIPLLTIIILVTLGIRLFGVTEIGVGGSDTILYYTLAEAWLKGDLTFRIGDSIEVFRPVLLAFNALALGLFGHADYSIKLANCLVDVLNMVLLGALAWQLTRRHIVVIASVATYGLLPIAIWSTRQELPHTLSTFFVLLSCGLTIKAIWATDQLRTASFMALGSLALTGAVLVHEELLFIALPLALTFLLGKKSVTNLPVVACVPALALFLLLPGIAALLVLMHEMERVVSVVARPAGDVWATFQLYPERVTRFAWNGVVGASSSILAISSGVGAIYYLVMFRRKRTEDAAYVVGCGLCLATPILFIALYALFFGTVFPRGILPVMPLLIIAVYFSLDRILAEKPPAFMAVSCLFLVLVYSISSLASFTAFKVGNRRFGRELAAMDWPSAEMLKRGYGEFLVDARYVPSYASHWKKVHDVLGDKVDEDHRLLIVPSTVFYAAGRRALQTDVYLGDNAVYRLDHFDQPLAQTIRQKNIRYILFTLGQSRGVPSKQAPYQYEGQWGKSRPVDLAGAYGMPAYSAQAEYQQIAGLMQAMGARPLSLFPQDSFESRVTRVWRLP